MDSVVFRQSEKKKEAAETAENERGGGALRYEQVRQAKFLRRLNRFVAEVRLADGRRQRVHVPNTGRCRELLVPGAQVVLSHSENPKRKLPDSLVSVYRGQRLVNIDSQNPNRLAAEALAEGRLLGFVPSFLRREYSYGDSRLDLMFTAPDGAHCLMEVKGCTLEVEGRALFPDAPTLRGVKHLRELTAALAAGWRSYVVFVIQMKGVTEFCPNWETHRAFGETLAAAAAAGVRVLAFDSWVMPDRVVLADPVSVRLDP